MLTEKIRQCRKCGQQIFWHKSERTGRFYPTDSATDRRAFHKCSGATERSVGSAPTPAPVGFDPEPTLEERISTLEKQLVLLTRQVQAVRAAQPIDDSDVGF